MQRRKDSPILIRLYRAAFWSAAFFALVMASLPQPPPLPGSPNDKIQHIIAFAVLAVLAALAFPRTGRLYLLLGLSAFGAAIELIQMIPQLHRDASWLDWSADTGAAAAVFSAFWVFRRLAGLSSGKRPGAD
jgi:hypothetical protein